MKNNDTHGVMFLFLMMYCYEFFLFSPIQEKPPIFPSIVLWPEQLNFVHICIRVDSGFPSWERGLKINSSAWTVASRASFLDFLVVQVKIK